MPNKKQTKETLTIGVNASFARKPQTGIGQVTMNFIRELAKYKFKEDTKVILYLEEDLPKSVKLPNNFTKKVFLPMWKRDDLVRKTWWEESLLPEKVADDKCNVFFSLYQSATVLHSTIGARHIMLVHDLIPRLFPAYLDNLRKKAYQKMVERGIKKADKILTVSKQTEKDLVKHLKISEKKITVNYIDVDEIYKKKVTRESAQKVLKKYKLKPGYILAGGGLEARKNIEGVISAYHLLLEKNKNEHFVAKFPNLTIYGKLMPQLAPLVTDAKKLVKKLNLTSDVQLLNAVPQEHLPAIFSSASMFLYPSFYEGFGMPPLEAMNQGIPTIVSKTSSLPEVGGDAVLYCHPKDPKDIAMVMKNLMVKKELRETLSRRGKARAKQFSWEKFVGKVMHVIEN